MKPSTVILLGLLMLMTGIALKGDLPAALILGGVLTIGGGLWYGLFKAVQ